MKRLLPLLLLLLCASQTPSQAQTQSDEPQLKPVMVEPRKLAWKYRHPKIYKVARKTRTVCIFVGPILNVSANVLTAMGEMGIL